MPAAQPASPACGTVRPPRIGDIVLVHLGPGIERPLLVTFVATSSVPAPDGPAPQEVRVCGTLHCEPDDWRTEAYSGGGPAGDPGQFFGRPSVLTPTIYAFMLREGTGIREWRHTMPAVPAARPAARG